MKFQIRSWIDKMYLILFFDTRSSNTFLKQENIIITVFIEKAIPINQLRNNKFKHKWIV